MVKQIMQLLRLQNKQVCRNKTTEASNLYKKKRLHTRHVHSVHTCVPTNYARLWKTSRNKLLLPLYFIPLQYYISFKIIDL